MDKSILIVGNFGIGALEHQYVKHLRNLQWEVFTFDIQQPVNTEKNKSYLNKVKFKLAPSSFYKTVNEELVLYAEKKKPLVTLIFKGMEIFPETLGEIKIYTKILCNYNPDHPFQFYSKGAGNENVKNSIKLYDLYGTYASNIAITLKKQYQVNSFILPFGYDSDIVPNLNPSYIDYFGFIGAFDSERQQMLLNIRKFPVQIFGDRKWSKLDRMFTGELKIMNKPLFNKAYASYCQSSLGILNFLRPQNILEQSHNMRTFEVPGYGGLLIANRTDEQLSFFEEDKEAVYFENMEELNDKLAFLLKNRSVVEKIKNNAINRSLKGNYSYANRAQSLNEIFNEYV